MLSECTLWPTVLTNGGILAVKRFFFIGIVIVPYDNVHTYSDPNSSNCIKKPILTLGRQPSSDVIVLSPTLHVTEDGTLIPFDKSEYVWVESIMKKTCHPYWAHSFKTFSNL